MRDVLDSPFFFLLVITIAVVAMAHALGYGFGKLGLKSMSDLFTFKNVGS